MTMIYYGINPGIGGPDSVIVSVGASTGAALEVVIDNTKITKETSVKVDLTKIMVAIQQKRLNIS